MKRVALLGLFTDRNFGDPLICRSCRQLFEMEAAEPLEWVECDLRHPFMALPRTSGVRMLKYMSEGIRRIQDPLSAKALYKLRICILEKVFSRQLDGCDAAVIAGGGIVHYRHHDYWQTISAFIKACWRKEIPVAINAVGIEDYDPDNVKCRILSEFFSYPNIKAATTRDDLEALQHYFGNSRAITSKVADPVIFCSKTSGIAKVSDSETIGIGIIRKEILADYRESLPVSELTGFYADLIKLFDREHVPYRLFTNGLDLDLDILPDLERLTGHSLEVDVPQDADGLISTIASFKGIITARMHSWIVAYSLDIPAVGFAWNRKLPFWASNIGKPDCCMSLYALDASDAWKRLQDAGEYDPAIRSGLEKDYLESVRRALSGLSVKVR